ncbi:MAG: hypothetical protein WCT36_03645 [Candidatus Gracilibacteria bacterium]
MIKISEAITEILTKNPFLQFGFHYRLFNLSQLSAFIKPQIEARTKKEVKTSAITMSLSRSQKQLSKITIKPEQYKAENITTYSNLCIMTFIKKQEIHAKINKFYEKIQKEKTYITISEGVNEITIIFENKFIKTLQSLINEKPKYKKENISAIGIKFDEKYTEIPGLIHFLVQHFMIQNINIIEISSTYTELFFYIDKNDTKLAFNTLFNRFLD